jgi:hypothetical protein
LKFDLIGINHFDLIESFIWDAVMFPKSSSFAALRHEQVLVPNKVGNVDAQGVPSEATTVAMLIAFVCGFSLHLGCDSLDFLFHFLAAPW